MEGHRGGADPVGGQANIRISNHRTGRITHAVLKLDPGWYFYGSGVHLDAFMSAGHLVVLVNAQFFSHHGGYRTYLYRVSRQGKVRREMYQYARPGGYLILTNRGMEKISLLIFESFWDTLDPAWEGEGHDDDHRFRLITVDLGARFGERHVRFTRRRYPYWIFEESRFLKNPHMDPLRKLGKRWPRQWTPSWRETR
jgi:hypothetical protein